MTDLIILNFKLHLTDFLWSIIGTILAIIFIVIQAIMKGKINDRN